MSDDRLVEKTPHDSEANTSTLDRPVEVEGVEEVVDSVLDYLHFDPDDRKTVSIVVRGEDGEVLGESFPQIRSGVYMLARVNEPNDLEEYKTDRPEHPEWVEWVYKDEPMDHFAEGVRCSVCGETDTIIEKAPSVASEFDWDGVRHRPECPHADGTDKAHWATRRMASAVRNRPAPRVMALDCIWEEIDSRPQLKYSEGRLRDALGDRNVAIREELKRRLGISYPKCPNCGEDALFLNFDVGMCCSNCYNSKVDVPAEVYDEVQRKRRRVWGFVGHLDRGRSAGGGDDGD